MPTTETSSPDQAHPGPLLRAAVDVEKHVAQAGWDQPPRLFALVRTSLLRDREPALATQLRTPDDEGYTAVEQERLPRRRTWSRCSGGWPGPPTSRGSPSPSSESWCRPRQNVICPRTVGRRPTP
ncbi:PPA1309 family protein [Serinicoccus marinus]|uniref:PPA1309 family protein n=1 Tax=Serinicoccus marinus TaxID=247333 RepID=UPI0030B8DF1D